MGNFDIRKIIRDWFQALASIPLVSRLALYLVSFLVLMIHWLVILGFEGVSKWLSTIINSDNISNLIIVSLCSFILVEQGLHRSVISGLIDKIDAKVRKIRQEKKDNNTTMTLLERDNLEYKRRIEALENDNRMLKKILTDD